MLFVLTLEIIGRTGDKAAQLTAQQQRRHDIAVVVGRLVSTGIADGHREGGLRCRQLQTDGDGVVRGIGGGGTDGVDTLDGLNSPRFLFIPVASVHEEQTVGQYLTVTVEQGHIIDTSGKAVERQPMVSR